MGLLMLIIGFCGAGAFSICSLPQVIKAYRTKSTGDISIFFIILSIIGNLCSAAYIFYTNWISGMWQYPQYVNYSLATILIFVLLGLKLRYDASLTNERDDIDKIDEAIVGLLRKRMELVSKIEIKKKQAWLSVKDISRAAEILSKIRGDCKYDENIRRIYSKIFEESRNIEKED